MAILTIRNSSCTEPQGGCVEYGYLYNWYAATDVRNIANEGWRVPERSEWENIITYVGIINDFDNYAGKLKEIGYDYWDEPNTEAENLYKFNIRGGGQRQYTDGVFSLLNTFGFYYTSTTHFDNSWQLGFKHNNRAATFGSGSNKNGLSVKLISDTPATGLANGTTGTYTGNDGKVYNTVVVNETWWLAENLAETLYRNGDPIPTIEDAATWAGLTTGAKCAYNNDYTNVGCGETG